MAAPLIGLAMGMGAAHAQAGVEQACAALPDPCLASGNIVVLAPEDVAPAMLASAHEASRRFETYFRVAPRPAAIVSGGEVSTDLKARLESEGINTVLPWLSASDRARMKEESIRRQLADLPDSVRDAAIRQALAQTSTPDPKDSGLADQESGALRHELGHLWFMAAFTPEDAARQTGHGYGGWAPDWLDETAAILLETPSLADKRRQSFHETHKHEHLKDLATFLSMVHPSAGAARQLQQSARNADQDAPGTAGRVMFLSGEEAEAFLRASGGAAAPAFYGQARLFADFLMEKTGDEQVFASITRHHAAGGNFESWLVPGEAGGLPETLKAFEAARLDWLNAN